PGATSALQVGQELATAALAPQPGQNFAPAGIDCPQAAQATAAAALAPQPGQNLAPAGIATPQLPHGAEGAPDAGVVAGVPVAGAPPDPPPIASRIIPGSMAPIPAPIPRPMPEPAAPPSVLAASPIARAVLKRMYLSMLPTAPMLERSSIAFWT